MLLQEPAESPYDLRFSLFGFPVRIAWTFWLGAAVFGYGLVKGLDEMAPDLSPGLLPLLVLWALCLFVSILIHELGHALAFRQYGIESAIVLYHFGGLAIPFASRGGYGASNFASSLSMPRLNEKAEMWIAFAGPLAQVSSAAVLVAAVKMAGYRVIAFKFMPWPVSEIPSVE